MLKYIIFFIVVSSSIADTTILFPINALFSGAHGRRNFWKAFVGGAICATAKQLVMHDPPLQCRLLNDIGASLIEQGATGKRGLRFTYGPVMYDTYTDKVYPMYGAMIVAAWTFAGTNGKIDWHETISTGVFTARDCDLTGIEPSYIGLSMGGSIFYSERLDDYPSYLRPIEKHELIHEFQMRQMQAFASAYTQDTHPVWKNELVGYGLFYLYDMQWLPHNDRPLEIEAGEISGVY